MQTVVILSVHVSVTKTNSLCILSILANKSYFDSDLKWPAVPYNYNTHNNYLNKYKQIGKSQKCLDKSVLEGCCYP